jgi:hypothetical protein
MNTQETGDTRIVDPGHLPFAYQDALNAGHTDAVLALFHQDATMRTFNGRVLAGRECAECRRRCRVALHAAINASKMTRRVPTTIPIVVHNEEFEAF